MSYLEDRFELLLKVEKIRYEREFKFHPVRKWRFDFVIEPELIYTKPGMLLAVEVEGGIFMQGRHNRGNGMLADMEKYNAATVMGWRILRYSTPQLGSVAIDQINQIREQHLCLANRTKV